MKRLIALFSFASCAAPLDIAGDSAVAGDRCAELAVDGMLSMHACTCLAPVGEVTSCGPSRLFNGDLTPETNGRPRDPVRDALTFVDGSIVGVAALTYEAIPVAPQPSRYGIAVLAVPMSGRQSGSVTVRNLSDPTIGMQLAAYRGVTGAAEAILVPFTPVVNSGVLTFSFKSSTDGLWDLLLLELGGGDQVHGGPSLGYTGGPVPIAITLSDDP